MRSEDARVSCKGACRLCDVIERVSRCYGRDHGVAKASVEALASHICTC